MEEAVRRAIARIDVIDGSQVLSRGTGFLVGPGLVLTALHVVANRHQDPPQFLPGRIVLTFPGGSREARVHPSFFDRRSDWALLTCDGLDGVRPLPMAELQGTGGDWETYGFPDANPRDGMVQRGTVENHLGDLEGVPAFQLFSRQAAAGNGAPVKGLSGGPMLVDGALVGLLRFALMKDGQAVAGTLYACPVAAPLARCGDLFPVPDPCHGLPGLRRRPLPAKPFRYLDRFTAADAEIFFGRNREIRELYLRLNDDGASRVVLLYGQSGVGKSSFLDAGLLPRLEWYHEVRYVRREARKSLTETLLAAVRPENAPASISLASAWRQAETGSGKPLVVVLDQVEEVYTRPSAQHPEELPDLFGPLLELFGDPAGRPRGRLVLSFRKEWFPEIQKLFETCGLDYGKVFLEGLDRDAILEVVGGLTRTPRLRERYGLEVQGGLAESIANDLLADRDSPIAPTLQILLTRMWQEASAESQSAPRFTAALYRRLKDEGYLLGDFLDQQLQKLGRGTISPEEAERLGEMLDRQIEKLGTSQGLSGWSERSPEERAEVVESGLVLDVLVYHTTSYLTAEQRTERELNATYGHASATLPLLVQAMKSLFLLTDLAGDGAEASRGTRLAHDTLAPLVRQRFDASVHPGQRARRVLENRGDEWKGGKTGAPLDGRDLRIVEDGLKGMRAVQPDEQRLLGASRRERAKRRRNVWLLRAAGLAVLLGVAGLLWWMHRQDVRNQLLATPYEVQRFLAVEPVTALTESIAATGDSLDLFHEVFTPVQLSLLRSVEEARETARFNHGAAVHSVAASPDGKTVASAGDDGVIRLWSLDGGPPRALPKSGNLPRALAFNRDGLLASLGDDGKVRIWSPADGTLRATSQGGHTGTGWTVDFSPDGKTIASGGDDGTVRFWDLQGAPVGAPTLGHEGAVYQVVFSPDGTKVASAGEDGSVRFWNLQGESLGEPFRGNGGPIYTLAFSPDGESLATGGEDGTVRQWAPDGRDLYPPLRRHEGAVSMLIFVDANTLASASDDQTVLITDRFGHRLMPPFQGPDGSATWLATIPGRNEMVIGSDDNTVRIIDFERSQIGPPLQQEKTGVGVRRLAFAAGKRLLSLGSGLRVFDLEKPGHPELLSIPLDAPDGVTAVALGANAQRIAAGRKDGSLQLWDAAGKRLGPPLAGGGEEILALELPGDGKHLLSGDAGGDVVVRDSQDGRVLSSFKGNRKVSAVAFRADGERIAAGTEDGQILTWDLQGTVLHEPFSAGRAAIRALAWNPVSPYLAIGGADGYLSLWDLDSGTMICREKAHNFEVSSLDWSPHGDSLISSGNDRIVRLWGLRCRKVGELVGHWKTVNVVAFAPGGETAASAGRDGTLRLWHADWHSWLELGCDRLRQHPAFTAPPDDRSRRALAVCQSRVWKKG